MTYYAAMAAINSLDYGDLLELKSFNTPPRSIHIVGEALCIMFNQTSAEYVPLCFIITYCVLILEWNMF